MVFFAAGAVGLAWVLWWYASYRESNDASAATLDARLVARELSFLNIVSMRRVQVLVFAKFMSDSAWYFYLFWLPKYLYDVRGFDVKHVSYYAWIPYAASGLGSFLGGWLSSALLSRGRSLDFSRKFVLGLSALFMPVVMLVPHVPVGWALMLFSIAFFCQQSWSGLIMTLAGGHLSPFGGGIGCGAGWIWRSALAGAIFGLVAGFLLGSWIWIWDTVYRCWNLSPDRIRSHSALGRQGATASDTGLTSREVSHEMKITEVRTRVVQWEGKTTPLPPHFCTNPMDLVMFREASMGNFAFHGWVLVEIFTDAGLVGLGNAALSPLVTKACIDTYLKPLLLGADPWDIEFLWQQMYRRTMAFGRKGVGMTAISAVDIALWDLLGKSAKQPVYRLLGGRTKERIPVYASRLYSMPLDELRAEAQTL